MVQWINTCGDISILLFWTIYFCYFYTLCAACRKKLLFKNQFHIAFSFPIGLYSQLFEPQGIPIGHQPKNIYDFYRKYLIIKTQIIDLPFESGDHPEMWIKIWFHIEHHFASLTT